MDLAILSRDKGISYSPRSDLEACAIEKRYSQLLTLSFVRSLFAPTSNVEDFRGELELRIEQLRDETSKESALLLTAVACLEHFIQINWTGPIPAKPAGHLADWSSEQVGCLQSLAKKDLSESGEECYNLMVCPELLWFARLILFCPGKCAWQSPTVDWWRIRCLVVWQQTFSHRLSLIWDQLSCVRQTVMAESSPLLALLESNHDLLGQLHLELLYACLFYSQYPEAKEHVRKAIKYVGLVSINFTGALGKRTRFQERSMAQLTLDVQTTTTASVSEGKASMDNEIIPKDVPLNDDTVLNSINFEENVEKKPLTALQHAALLAVCTEYEQTNPVHGLTSEFVMPYVEAVLSQPTSWCTQTRALLMRSRLEANSSRRAERSMMQVQALVDQFSAEEPSVSDRLHLFHCCSLPPHWMTQRQLAGLLSKLGVVKGALEIFERLQMWDDVIACLQVLGRHGEAERLVRSRLAVEETVSLWCCLGDLTRDPSHYERAWEVSSQRSARAQRCLGMLYLKQGKFSNCIESLQKSLAVNSLQEGLWFSLGCAAMAEKQLELAANAFHRCVALEYDNYEAWNNLASVYIHLKETKKAHRILREALRCNFEKWQIWENFALVCADTGEFEDLIEALHRLTDLKPKSADGQILTVLVEAIVSGVPDSHSLNAKRLLPKAIKLFGHVTSKVTNDACVWEQYSRLHSARAEVCDGEEAQLSREKAVRCLQSAHRLVSQSEAMNHSVNSIFRAVDVTLDMSKACQKVAERSEPASKAIQVLSSAKLGLRGLLTRAKNFDGNTDDVAKLQPKVTALDDELQLVISKITQLKGQ